MKQYLSDQVLAALVSKRQTNTALFLDDLYNAEKENGIVTVSEAAQLTRFSIAAIRRILSKNNYLRYLDYSYYKRGLISENNSRGRPEKCFLVPSLKELEEALGCTERTYKMDFSDAETLKNEVAALGLLMTGKVIAGKNYSVDGKVLVKEKLSNGFMMDKSGMKKDTWRKYSKKSMRSIPQFEREPLKQEDFEEMPETYIDAKNKFFLEAGGQRFAYTRSQARLAIHIYGMEAIQKVRQLPSKRIYIGNMSDIDLFALDTQLVENGEMTMEQYQKLHSDMFFIPHREHEHLIAGLRGADEILRTREREEERRILKATANLTARKMR